MYIFRFHVFREHDDSKWISSLGNRLTANIMNEKESLNSAQKTPKY